MSDHVHTQLLAALEHASAAFAAIEAVGGSLNQYGNSSLLEIRCDLARMIRRINNVALIHGVPPSACETARTLHEAEAA